MIAAKIGFRRRPVFIAVVVGIIELALGVLMLAIGLLAPSEGLYFLEMRIVNPLYALAATAPLAYVLFSGGIEGLGEEGISIGAWISQSGRGGDSEEKKYVMLASLRPGGGIFLIVNGVCVSCAGLWLLVVALIGS